MFWVAVFLSLSPLVLEVELREYNPPVEHTCVQTRSESGLWWDRYFTGTGGCEVLDENKEMCGVCGTMNVFDIKKLGNLCHHIELLWKFDFQQVTQSGKTQQFCLLTDHCKMSYAIKRAQDEEAKHKKNVTNYVNHICGTETKEGRREKRGDCESVYGTYICECKKPYQGRDCNDLGPKGAYATGVQVLLDTKVRVSTSMAILVAVKTKGTDLKVHINLTLFDVLITFTEPIITDPSSTQLIQYCLINTGLTKRQCKHYLKESTAMYRIEVRFPLVRESYVWYYSQHFVYPIGYYTNFTVTTTNTIDGEEKESFWRTNYDRAYSVFVQYPTDIGCYKNTELSNCATLKDAVNIYDASKEIVLYGFNPTRYILEIHKIDCTHGEDFIKWTISRVMPSGTFYAVDELEAKSAFEFVIKPYSFTNGMYVVEFSYTRLSVGAFRENFDRCFFTVVEAPTIAIISGGRVRFIDVDSIIPLDGSSSYDPNLKDPSSKERLNFEWSCITNETREPCLEDILSSKHGSRNFIELPPSTLQVKNVYVIKVIVRKVGKRPAYASQTLLAGRMKDIESIGLVCVNCMEETIANPTDFIYLLVHVVLKPNAGVQRPMNFTWSFSSKPESLHSVSQCVVDSPADDIRVGETSQDLFKVDKNKLEYDKKYCFRAAIPHDKFAYSEIDISVHLLNDFNCTLSPDSGTVAVTNFTLKCSNVSGLIYEVYDKSSNDSDYYSGRMLFTGFDSPYDNNFSLANGMVVVYGYNKYKMVKKWAQEVKLAPFVGHLKDIEDMMSHLDQIKIYPQRLLHAASAVSAALNPEMKWSLRNIRKSLVSLMHAYLDPASLQQMRFVKLVLSSLQFILVETTKRHDKTELRLEVEEAKLCADIISAVARSVFGKVKDFNSEGTLTQTILHQMIKSHLDIIEMVLTVKDNPVLSRPLRLINPYVLHLVKDVSYELVDALYKMSLSLLWRQVQGDSATEIVSTESKITEWCTVQHPSVLYQLREHNENIHINFSSGFYEIIDELDELGVQVTTLTVNPFWWAGGDINTNILLVDICFKVNLTKCTFKRATYKAPIFLYFNITETFSSISPVEMHTVYLDRARSVNDLDLAITVYRFDPPPRAKLFIHFEFYNSTEDYTVLFTKNLRPDYETMEKIGLTINNANQSSVKYLGYTKDVTDKLYYLGIYPVQEGSAGTRVKFNLTIVYAVCKTWLRWKWGSQRCWVGERETDYKTLRCDCNHLSMFGGSLQIPPYQLNPAIKFSLFLTEEFNWLPLIVLVTVFVVAALLYIWGRYKDKADSKRGIVTLLEDNFPGERFGYLIGVYTGSRMNSSTDANVGIKLIGRESSSRAHVLNNNNSPTLRGNCDEWFLLYSLEHLGTLEQIHLWHDHSGDSPNWFVEKVEVFDLTEKFQYIFELHMWLTLGVNEFPDVVVQTSSIEEFYSVRNVFVSNFIAGLRDANYWTSIFWKHPRHPVKRVYRIRVVLCYIMVAMLCSVIVYFFNRGADYEEDVPEYELDSTDYIIFAITLSVASFPACLEMFLFRKSFSYKYVRMQSSLFLRPDATSKRSIAFHSKQTENVSPVSSSTDLRSGSLYGSKKSRFIELTGGDLDERYIAFGLRGNVASERSVYEHFAAVVHAVVRGSTLEPVRLPKYKSNLVVHKPFLIKAWILFLGLVLAAIAVTVLFGLRIPKVESEKWLTVFLLVLLCDAIILSNVKILVCSMILACVFQRLVPASNYQLKSEDGMKKNLMGNVNHMHKLLDMRSDVKYCPLHGELKELRRRKCLTVKHWKTLVDFCMVLLLIFVLFMLTSLIITTNISSSNAHAPWVLTKGPSYKQGNFTNIYNTTLYSNFIVYDFADKLHRSSWYNQDDLLTDDDRMRRSWTYDCTMRLLGNARIRQLRVLLGECSKVRYVENLTEYCSPAWSSAVEDTGTYGSRWAIGGRDDTIRRSTAWRHTAPAFSNSSQSYGPTLTSYPTGGFIEDLGFEKDQMEYAFSRLFPQNWLDHMTRAVFVELTLYNVNTRLLTEVVLAAEQLPFGQYLVDVRAESLAIDLRIDFWKFTFGALFIFLLVRSCFLINRSGLFVYFSKAINLFEVFILVLGYTAMSLYLKHITSSSEYFLEFQSRGMDEFFNFAQLFANVHWARKALCVLFVCLVVRMFYSFRFGRIYFTFYYLFLLSTPWIVWLVVALLLYLSVLRRLAGHLLSTYVFQYYTSLILFYKDATAQGCQDYQLKLLVCTMCFLSYLVTLLFVTKFTYYYRLARLYKSVGKTSFNFIPFLREALFGEERNDSFLR